MNKTSYREIGSEFWDIPVLSQGETALLPKGLKWFLSGRVALEYIIFDIKQRVNAKTVAMPSWCCDSMIIPFVENGIEVIFYTFDKTEEIPNCDILFCMEHFGYIRQEREINFPGIVIHDVTHSAFSKNMGIKKVWDAKQQYFFGSLRKWAGFKTGGFAGVLDAEFSVLLPQQTCDEYVDLRSQAMREKLNYITGETDAKEYLNMFSRAEEMLEDGVCGSACVEDVFLAEKLDVDSIKKHRRANASVLLQVVSDMAIYPELKADDCPLFVPIRLKTEARDALRKYLIENDVFCPIHWPLTDYHRITGEQRKIYEEELSLVCDQRYTTSDMQYVCELINKFRRM